MPEHCNDPDEEYLKLFCNLTDNSEALDRHIYFLALRFMCAQMWREARNIRDSIAGNGEIALSDWLRLEEFRGRYGNLGLFCVCLMAARVEKYCPKLELALPITPADLGLIDGRIVISNTQHCPRLPWGYGYEGVGTSTYTTALVTTTDSQIAFSRPHNYLISGGRHRQNGYSFSSWGGNWPTGQYAIFTPVSIERLVRLELSGGSSMEMSDSILLSTPFGGGFNVFTCDLCTLTLEESDPMSKDAGKDFLSRTISTLLHEQYKISQP